MGGAVVVVSGHIIGATDAVNLPTSGCTGDDAEGGDVWHKVTLTAGKSYLISSKAASGYDHALYMLSSCANPTTTTATYYIAVDTSYITTSSYASGSYDLGHRVHLLGRWVSQEGKAQRGGRGHRNRSA